MMKKNVQDIVLAITYRCNARCQMCSIWRRMDKSPEVSAEMVVNLPENAQDINLTGGEPFLHSDLPGLVKVIVERCPRTKIIISSNGFATDLILAQMKKIKEIKPDVGLAISVDGIGVKHDEVRGVQGGYENILKTIAELRKIGIDNLRLAFTIGDYNYDHLEKVYDLTRQLNIELTIAAVHSSENYFGQKNEIKNLTQIVAALDDLIKKELSSWSLKRMARAYFAFGLKKFLMTGERILPDYSGQESIFIDPTGDIYPCDIANEKIGKLSNNSFEIKEDIENNSCAKSWMICTARQAMKRHWFKVGIWVLKNKFNYRIVIPGER